MARTFASGLLLSLVVIGCAGELSGPASSSTAIVLDTALPPAGIDDHGDDPAVVAVASGSRICAGTLLAPDAVLTSRRCVSVTAPAACSDGAPQTTASLAPESVRVLSGDRLAAAAERALGRQVVVPEDGPCGADVAILLLDTPIGDVQPLSVRATGAATGDALRTVGYASADGPSGQAKVVRDNVLVQDVAPTELTLGEACSAVPGGPAVDAATAEVVGVASRAPGPSCGGPGAAGVYVRADAYLAFVTATLERYALPSGTSTGKAKTRKGDVDVGAPCAGGADCAAGVCVTDGARQYCSHLCDTHDRCPTHWRCKRSAGALWACSG